MAKNFCKISKANRGGYLIQFGPSSPHSIKLLIEFLNSSTDQALCWKFQKPVQIFGRENRDKKGNSNLQKEPILKGAIDANEWGRKEARIWSDRGMGEGGVRNVWEFERGELYETHKSGKGRGGHVNNGGLGGDIYVLLIWVWI